MWDVGLPWETEQALGGSKVVVVVCLAWGRPGLAGPGAAGSDRTGKLLPAPPTVIDTTQLVGGTAQVARQQTARKQAADRFRADS